MSEDTYAKIDPTKKVRFQTEQKDADAEKTENVLIYENCSVESTPPQSQDTTEDQQESNECDSISVNAPSAKRDLIRPAVVLLVVLYLLLMGLVIVVTVLWIQDRSLNINLTRERIQLQTSYRDMKSLNENLTSERNQLQADYSDEKNLTIQLQNNISVVTKERDDFKKQLETPCPPNWVKVESSCYLITSLEKNWHDSQQHCESEGGHLPIISSKKDQEFLNLFRRSWIGLTDEEEEDVWKWVDGTMVKETYWANNQPDNYGRNEHCVHIRYSGLNSWNDIHCTQKLPVICQNNTLFN